MSTTTPMSGTLKWIRADRLTIPQEYQRPLSKRKVAEIANDFDPDAIGVLTVSHRPDGTNVLIDGQHRQAAFIFMDYGDQKLPCFVHEGLTLAQEAAIWGKTNDKRTKPRPMDIYRAALVAEDPEAVAIAKVLAGVGMEAAEGGSANRVQAIGAVKKVFTNAGPEKLADTLAILRNAWGADSSSFQGDVLVAVGAILARYSKVEQKRLEQVLNKTTSQRLVGRARIMKVEMGTSGTDIGSMIAEILVREYNARRADDKRIAPWEDRGSQSYWWSDDRPVNADTARIREHRARKAS